jgi:GT2 family glycosyltransferase/glycosyltransferase involved in cell wall biosynthesis
LQALQHEREQMVAQLQDAQHECGQMVAQLQDLQQLRSVEQRQQAQSLASAESQAEQVREQRLELIARTRDLSRERDEARQLVRAIETTRLFRATRPIVRAKLRFERLIGKKIQPRSNAGPISSAPSPIASPTLPVDVIVPVYRGLEDTRRCIESVLRAVCQTPWRLILINDASPEPELATWLRGIATTDARITLLEHEPNLGFVGSVNRGMAQSQDNDVLLLNSDTEVADGWLDRLRAPAYSDRRVATVTPFSNNATICSYPRFCQDNDLPEGWDTARLDALCARVNAGQTVDVPTGVGFCMYIRRAALTAVGPFDEEHFGKGYGEENDFCVRAQAAGWRNLHALDVFVRHCGGVSFGAAKGPRERAAMETLRRLHPRYEGEVLRFIQADPARLARYALDAARVLDGGKPVILAVLHDRNGGTERHVFELASLLRQQARFLVLRPAPNQRVTLRLAGADEAFELSFALGSNDDLPSETGIRDEHGDDYVALLAILRAFGVCHVHYHHRMGHGVAIAQLARRLGLAYDFTAHDYYTICPQITLTGRNQDYCGEQGECSCNACLQCSSAPDGQNIVDWRRNNAAFFNRARFVIVPSRAAWAHLQCHMPTAPFRLVPHTDIDPRTPPDEPHPPRLEGQRSLKVAVIGALSVIKGADLLEDAAAAASRIGAPVEFHLLGYGYRALKTQPSAYLTAHGQYAEADLPGLLTWLQPDVVWFPARWPETYSYTLSACLQGGWPVVAPDIGAFPERLAGRSWTWIEPWQSSAVQWLAFFMGIRERHYLTGTPPVPPLPVLPELPASVLPGLSPRDWYAGPYLTELPRANNTGELTPELRALIAAHLLGRRNGDASLRNLRRLTLQLLVRARAWPPLAGLVRSIPYRWQTRTKSWLLK